MRKALVFTLIIFVLAAAVIGYAFASINSTCDELTFTEETLLGDPSCANGLIAEYSLSYQRHALWKNHISFDNGLGECSSEFSFSRQTISDYDTHMKSSVLMANVDESYSYNFLDHGSSSKDKLPQCIRDYAEKMQPDKTTHYTFKLNEMYDYYPIYFFVDLPGYGCDSSLLVEYEMYMEQCESNPDETHKITFSETAMKKIEQMRDLRDFFKIPVLDDEYSTATIYKDRSGEYDVQYSGGETNKGDYYYFYSQGVSIENEDEYAYYFYIPNVTTKGNKADMSEIPGGYGIYKLPYSYKITGNDTVQTAVGDIDTSGLDMVYPLDENTAVEYMGTNCDRNRLVMVTREEGVRYLNIIDTADMNTLQRFVIDEAAGDAEMSWFRYYDGDNYLLTYSDKARIKAFYESKPGYYEKRLDISAAKLYGGTEADLLSEFWTDDGMLGKTFLFNGDKLVAAAPDYSINYDAYFYGTANMKIAVLGSDGPEYFGRIKCSLDDCNIYPNDESEAACRMLSDDYNYNIKFMNFNPIRLGWGAGIE